jgi:uncharacterized protein YneR
VSGEDTFEVTEYTSTFVDNNIGIENTADIVLYLYDSTAAQIMAQRHAFFNSLSKSVVKIKAKSAYFTSSVNDKIYMDLDRLYKRYGGSDRLKMGVISGISKNEYDTEIVVNDLGNVFNRVCSIAADDCPVYASATRDDVARSGFVVDNDTETPDADSERDLGLNLIG